MNIKFKELLNEKAGKDAKLKKIDTSKEKEKIDNIDWENELKELPIRINNDCLWIGLSAGLIESGLSADLALKIIKGSTFRILLDNPVYTRKIEENAMNIAKEIFKNPHLQDDIKNRK